MKDFYFFLGTEAELIKTFPIIKEMESRCIPYYIIASGQNDISKSRVLQFTNGGKIDLILSNERDIKKSETGLFSWFFQTGKHAKTKILRKFPSLKSKDGNSVMIVHGDTISTVMGAYLGKSLGMKVAHIEAGLRSRHLFNPFPEEIDRILTDRKSDYLFVPEDAAELNVKKYSYRSRIVNTMNNTLVDSLLYSQEVSCDTEEINSLLGTDYFILVIHRQENMKDDRLVKCIVDMSVDKSQELKCVFILHKITEKKIKELGYMNKLEKNNNMVLLPRVDYFDFMKLLGSARFVMTDGGSNQGELSYMGVPTMILRQSTEQVAGLGENVLLFGGDYGKVSSFLDSPDKFRREKKRLSLDASKRIVDELIV